MNIEELYILTKDPYIFVSLLFFITSFFLIKKYYFLNKIRKIKNNHKLINREKNNFYLIFLFLTIFSISLSIFYFSLTNVIKNLFYNRNSWIILIFFSSIILFLISLSINQSKDIKKIINILKKLFLFISIIFILFIILFILINKIYKIILWILFIVSFFIIPEKILLQKEVNKIIIMFLIPIIIVYIILFQSVNTPPSKVAMYVYPYNINQIKTSAICNKTGMYPFNMTIYNSYDKYVILNGIEIDYKSYSPFYRLKPLMIPPHSEIVISDKNSSLFIQGEKNVTGISFNCKKLTSNTVIRIFTSEGVFSYHFPKQQFILNNTS